MKPTPPSITQFWGYWPTGDWGPFTFYTSHRRKVTVAYPRAPPKEPPSWKQRFVQQDFRFAAEAWTMLPNTTKAKWKLAAKQAHLTISGFNFWMYVQLRHDTAAARTVQRQSGVDLGF